MSLYQAPPETLTICGKEYPVDTDFRRWVEFQGILLKKEDNRAKAERLCGFMESLGLPQSNDTLEAMIEFYAAASREHSGGGKSRPQAFDFDQDSEFIYAAFLECYGVNLTTAQLHWWEFKAMFKSLPDNCQFARIMGYRSADMKDVPKSQKAFYREMKARYALSGEKTGYKTEEEMRAYVQKRFAEAQKKLSEANNT